eukprot:TRINITY_DN56934_c0_g1_i1.p1 TRINITY_DN56934_c0_g1~~TRINITY_DN56934_c0_g1_i1.p1  ORF type:complete len:554 (-),score=104.19 TRINITY_DN56934_c0_g1_i1:9-1670(-)
MATVQWMWGDASVVGHGAAKMNPLRWSSRKSHEATTQELQQLGLDERVRPVEMRFFEEQVGSGRQTCVSQHFRDVSEAIARLSSPLTRTVDHSDPARPSSFDSSAQSSSSEAAPQVTNTVKAGILEKQGQWRKEWACRFFVMREDRIDYFLNPPEVMSEENIEQRRGFIPVSQASPLAEDQRPYCIRIGNELLSCTSAAEQRAWISTINAAVAAKAQAARPRAEFRKLPEAQKSPLEATQLVLVEPDQQPRTINWNEVLSVDLPTPQSSVTILFLACQEHGSAASGAQAMCQVPLHQVQYGRAVFPIQLLSGEPIANSDQNLRIQVSSNSLVTAKAEQSLLPFAACVLAAALLLAGSSHAALLCVVLIAGLLLREAWAAPLSMGRRQVSIVLSGVEGSTLQVAGHTRAAQQPRWVGQWRLDKSCSESYDPVLADLGVSWPIRKAADAANSVMTISLTPTSVKVHIKIWVSVSEELPLDGSWATKPCPPGSRILKGNCQVCLTKRSENEMEMLTEFPDGYGQLRDTLTVSEDGRSFTRVVVRGALKVTRVFRRE